MLTIGKRIPTPEGELYETETQKIFRSENCNFNFNKITGYMETWGKTLDDNPSRAPFPFILDIEITTICNGPTKVMDNGERKHKLCSFCYKNNNPNGQNMTLEQFKNIIDKMPWLTQIALGADAQGVTNPEMFEMMAYARSKGIIPNLTIADVTPEIAEKLAKVAGAVAVSVYKHAGFDTAFDSIQNLVNAGQKQINIHYMISSKTIDDAYEVANAYHNDPRLKNLNAIVFLGLKQKGRGEKFDYVSEEQYKKLVDYCLEHDVPFGFDSCSAPAFLKSVEGHPNFEQIKIHSEDCESTLFSSYINEKGEFFPCSFTEKWKEGGWTDGISVLNADDFIADVWNNEKTESFRGMLLGNTDHNGCRNCPAFAVCSIDKRIFKEPEVIDCINVE